METAAARCPMPKRMSHGGPPADIRIDAASTVSHVGTITLTVLAFGQRPDRANSNSLADRVTKALVERPFFSVSISAGRQGTISAMNRTGKA